MSSTLIDVLSFLKKRAEENSDITFSLDDLATQLGINRKTIQYYFKDLEDTGFVEIVSSKRWGEKCLRPTSRLIDQTSTEWMTHKPGLTKHTNKVPHVERVPLQHIKQFYEIAKKAARTERDEQFIDATAKRLLDIGERTAVYSRGSAGLWIRCLNDLRQAESCGDKVIAIDSIISFIHGRGRIGPLIIQGSRAQITKILDSIAKK